MKSALNRESEVLIPEPIRQAADAAERRREAALSRLEVKLDLDGKTAVLERIIDLDKGSRP